MNLEDTIVWLRSRHEKGLRLDRVFLEYLKMDSRTFVERELSVEVLKSEKLRSGILMAVGILTLLWVLFIQLFIPDSLPIIKSKILWGVTFGNWLAIVAAALALYEYGLTRLFDYFLREGLEQPVMPRYFNAVVEVSIPTFVMFLASQAVESYQALFSPMEFLYFIFIILSILRMKFTLGLVTGSIAGVEYLLLAWFILSKSAHAADHPLLTLGIHLEKGLLLIMTGVIAGMVARQIRKRLFSSISTLDEKNTIVGIFGQHVSPSVVEKLISQGGNPDSEVREVCVMFMDIRGFTAFSEGKKPEDITRYLNHLFEFMVKIVNDRGGIINKFLGDGFMAVFGAPVSEGNDALNAVQASMDIIQRLEYEVAEGSIPETRIGIGLHTGSAVTGTVGSAARREYTVIGDVVNLASRLEQLNKRFGSTLLVSSAVMEQARPHSIAAEDLGMVEVRGHYEPVRAFRLA